MKRFALIGGIVSGLGTFGIIAYQFSPQIWVFLVGWLVPTLAFGALREHFALGLDNGLTPQEICEGLLQCAVYAGFPSCVEAMQVAHDVFGERGVDA